MNAKGEFLDYTKGLKVIGASITFGGYNDDDDHTFVLNPLYTNDEYNKFLKFLDREYDSGYGCQELFGTIYCEDGVWLDRGEYDGSEWWNIHIYPSLAEAFGDILVLKYERYKKLKNLEENQ